ncbi:phosphonate metabolism protein PhnJ [Neisseria wadsworthii 9715]|uniref:Phosphonate metabolism protein PhnJ n=1 Tax=Neisseria wadsworthii 9715 TaxID=1030841 RepID=G4CRH2_9NEIS|nr:phosphonate metabolism protein PhnJ [Neisseria wadsworthii 9715]
MQLNKPCFGFVKQNAYLKIFQTGLDSNFECNTQAVMVGTGLRIKHLAFHSQVFFLAGGSVHLEPCVSPDG